MKTFKVGDRVRIVYRGQVYGKEATIREITKWSEYDHYCGGSAGPIGELCYRVDVDGYGYMTPTHNYIGYQAKHLEPLVPPDELAWQKFREHLRPNPLVIFDADPIIVSTDEEAARIAETVPNSHIKVVIRGVVVSEYYGKSQTNRP